MVLFLLLLKPAGVDAQEGRNVFKQSRSPSSSAQKSKADELTREKLKQSLVKEFGSPASGNVYYYIVFFAILLVLVLILVRFNALDEFFKQSVSNSPWYLYRELCTAHQLTRAEKRFLREMAEELDLDDPLPLFIEPEYFKKAYEMEFFAPSHSTLRYLAKKLLGLKLPDQPGRWDEMSSASGQTHGGSTLGSSQATIVYPQHQFQLISDPLFLG